MVLSFNYTRKNKLRFVNFIFIFIFKLIRGCFRVKYVFIDVYVMIFEVFLDINNLKIKF